MPDVLLAGAFGQGNPGDEALLSAFLRSLPPGRVQVASSDPAATATHHGCDAFAPTPSAVARELARSDAVVVGGGTVFKLLHAASGRARHALLRNALLLAHGARTLGMPVLLVGVGVGDLSTRWSQRITRSLVRGADLLVLRDEESADVLTGIGAPAPFRVGTDPAWTVLDEPRETEFGVDATSRTAVIVVSHLAGGTELPRAVADWVRVLRDLGLRVRLQPWQAGEPSNGDGDLARRVAARVGDDVDVVEPPADLADARRQFAGARLVIGMRYHALMAAAAAGVPFVAVDHELKLGALARRFGQPCVAPTEPPAHMAAAARAALDGPPPARSMVLEQIALAEEGFRLLRLVLEGGGAPDADELRGLPLEPAPWEVAQ